jgi:Sulfotransferase domain
VTSERLTLKDARRRLVGAAVSNQVGRRVWNWWSHRRTDVYVLSYPKCGRTWLRLLMGKALVDELELADANPMELSDLHRASTLVPRIRVTHDDNPQLKRPEEVERDKRRYAGKKIVFLVRNPRDVVISYYFQASRRRDRFSGTPSEFLRHPVGALDTILTYYNVWADSREVAADFCLVRYEDLHRDAAGELARVLRLIGRAPSRAALEAAVEFARFDNMRALERKNAFGSARLRPADGADPESFKTRKGKVGGYRDYLSAEDLDYLEARIAERLSPFYADYRAAPAAAPAT